MSLLLRKGHTYLISCTLYSTAILWLNNKLLICYVTSLSSFFPTCHMISRQLQQSIWPEGSARQLGLISAVKVVFRYALKDFNEFRTLYECLHTQPIDMFTYLENILQALHSRVWRNVFHQKYCSVCSNDFKKFEFEFCRNILNHYFH